MSRKGRRRSEKKGKGKEKEKARRIKRARRKKEQVQGRTAHGKLRRMQMRQQTTRGSLEGRLGARGGGR